MEVASAVVLSRLSATYRSATLGMKMWLCSSVVSTLHALIATYVRGQPLSGSSHR